MFDSKGALYSTESFLSSAFFLQEYDAYKRHMSTLLGKEKELNNKLRILIG